MSILLIWLPAVEAEVDCTQQQSAESAFAAMQACVACEVGKSGQNISPASCRVAADLWCAASTREVKTYDDFISQCQKCEGSSQNTVNCADGAKNWCKSHCEDPRCQFEVVECKGDPMGLDDSKENCPPGHKRVAGKGCQPELTDLDANAAMNNCRAQVDTSDSICRAESQVATDNSAKSFKELCEAYRKGMVDAARDIATATRKCQKSVQECTSVCGAGATKFANESRFSNQVRTMEGGKQTCASFFEQTRRSAAQGFNLLSKSEVAKKCKDGLESAATAPPATSSPPGSSPPSTPTPPVASSPASGYNPSSSSNPNPNPTAQKSQDNGGGFPSIPSFGDSSPAAQPSPASYPYTGNAAYNAQQPVETQRPVAGPSGFREPKPASTGDSFNVGDVPNSGAGFSGAGAKAPNIPGGNGAQGPPGIANNSGGSIPGGNSGPGARIQPQGARRWPGGGVSTDVLQGFQGASGYNNPGGGSGFTEANSNGRLRPGRGGQARAPAAAGLDLRQYLPGGAYDPRRKVGAHGLTLGSDINASHVNIWRKVGDRLRQKCRLGELYGCR